jgi:hypothetical protein
LYGLFLTASSEGLGTAIAIRRILVDGCARAAIEVPAATASAMNSRRLM